MTGQTSSQKILADIKRTRLRTPKRVFVALLLIAGGGFVGMQWLAAFEAGAITFGAVAATVVLIAFIPIAAALLTWYAMLATQVLAAFFMVAPFWEVLSPTWLVFLWLFGAAIMIVEGFSVQMRSRAAISFNLGIFGGGIGILIIGFSLILTGLYYGATTLDGDFFISKEGIVKMLTLSQGVTSRILPGFTPNMSTEEFVNALVVSQEKNIVAELEKDPRYLALSEPQQRQARAQILVQFRQETFRNLSEVFDKPLNPQQVFVSFVYEYIDTRVAELSPATQRALFTTWLAVIFFTAWLFGMLLRPIIMIVSWIFLQILLGVRLIEVGRESVERKYLIFT